MTEWQIYWWLKLDDIQGVLVVIGVLGFCGCLFTWIGYFLNDIQNIKALIIATIVISLICIVATFMPSSKQYALIRVLPAITNSEIAKEVPADLKELYDMAKKYLKEKLEIK